MTAPLTRMLVVDDEQVITFAFQEYFECQDFAVETASTREEGLTALATREYDVVVVDLRLGGTDGAEGLDLIRAARERSLTVVIMMLTAYRSAAVESNALAAGADALLQKPLPLPRVAQTITELLARRRT